MSHPLAKGDAPAGWWNSDGTPSGSNQFGLTTATMGQFRCFAWWGDGSCQLVLIDTEVTNNFASTKLYTGISLTTVGAGNFGSSNLATDNAKILSNNSGCESAGTSSGYICVNTGTLYVQIKKVNFNLFDKVVGSDGTVYINGSADVVVTGPDTTQAAAPTPGAPAVGKITSGSLTGSATFYAKAECVGVSGPSAGGTVSASQAVAAGELLQVTRPAACTGSWNVFVGTSTAQSSMYLQNIQPISTPIWTEPTLCPLAGSGCFSGRGITNYLRGAVVYAGNSTGCGTNCATEYKASSDSSSTATIEENGPVKAVVRVSTGLMNGSVRYLGLDHKFTFYKGWSFVRASDLTKNAKDPCPAATLSTDPCYNTTHFESDYKGLISEELRIQPAFALTDFAFATDSTPVTGTLDNMNDAYLYQAYSNTQQLPESGATAYCTTIRYSCIVPEILRYPDPTNGFSTPTGKVSFAQQGYIVVANNANQATNTTGGSYGMGWADFSGSGGKGIEVGFWSMATEWPKAVQARYTGTGYEIRAGLLPDQRLFDPTTAQPYYFAWPAARVADTFINFHPAALSSAANEFLQFQYYLVGRASVGAYNRAELFGKVYPLLDPVAADNYMKGIGAYCPGTAGTCLPDLVAQNYRGYDWYQGGTFNQSDWTWGHVQEFIERGLTGRLLYSIYDGRNFMSSVLPRADGFHWRDRPVGTLTVLGFPDAPENNGKYRVGNAPLASRNWNTDPSHSHFYGGEEQMFYFTGESFLRDALDQAWGDYTLNANITSIAQGAQPASGFGQSRGVGQQITHRAHYYRYATSQKRSSDATQALSIASTILTTQMPLTLQARGFGNNVKGVSPSTGFPEFAQADKTTDTTDGPNTAVNISSISCNASTNKASVTLASPLPFNSPQGFGAPETLKVASVPVVNVDFNGVMTIDSGDRTTMTYPMSSLGAGRSCGGFSDSCSTPGSCGTVNVPGKCPVNTNGSCNAQPFTDTFMGPLLAQGLVELVSNTESSTSDPNAVWTNHTLAEDTALGILRFELYEVLLPQTGQVGNVYWLYQDYYNGDKHFANHPNCNTNLTYSNFALWWSLVGTMTAAEKAAFESYLVCYTPGSAATPENGAYVMEAGISHMPTFPNAAWPALVDATHSDSCVATDGDLGSPHCHLTITVPTNAARYRIKANNGKAIVDSLNFDNKPNPQADGSGCVGVGKYWSLSYGGTTASDWSGCYGLRPDQNWPFFSSTEVTNVPLPSGTTQNIVVSPANFSGFNTSTLSANKFAVKVHLGGAAPSPPVTGSTILRGVTCKGCVAK